jgi:hypothetical protein
MASATDQLLVPGLRSGKPMISSYCILEISARDEQYHFPI